MPNKMAQAIRIGCAAADVHIQCSYPDCTCTQIPHAVRAAVAFALQDGMRAVRDVAADVAREIADGR